MFGMNTATTREAVNPATSEKTDHNTVSQGFWTIERKIAGIVAILVIVGIGAMTAISADRQQSDMRVMSQDSGIISWSGIERARC
jgi:hypothetical protein